MYRFKIQLTSLFIVCIFAFSVACDDGDTESTGGDDGGETSEPTRGSSDQGDDEDEDAPKSDDDSTNPNIIDNESVDDEKTDSEEEEEEEGGESESGDDESDENSEAADPENDDEVSEVSYGNLPFYATGTVANINDKELTADEFNEAVAQQIGEVPREMIAGQGQEMMQMFIEAMVMSALLEQEIDKRGIVVSDSDVNAAMANYEQMLAQQQQQAGPGMSAQMAQQEVDKDMLRSQVELELATEKLIVQEGNINVTDAMIEEHYEQLVAVSSQQEVQVRASHILLHIDGNDEEVQERANQLASELEGGADFAALAQEHSDGPNASAGGELGYFSKEQFVPEFSAAAFDLDVGQISDPVRSELGWHIIYVHDRQDGGVPPLEEVRDDLRTMLKSQQLQQQAMQFIESLQQNADIEIDVDNVVFNE